MAIKGCEWARFVVWTFVEEISFDKLAWDTDNFLKLQSFYVNANFRN